MAEITDREMLRDVNIAIQSTVRTGQKYAIIGSHSIEKVPVSELFTMKKFYERRLLRTSGATGRNIADFTQDPTSATPDLRFK